jgi:chorismate mutase
MFQSQLHHCRATLLRRQRSREQPVNAIAQIIGNGTESQPRVVYVDHRYGEGVDEIIPLVLESVLSTGPASSHTHRTVAIRIATSCREDTPTAIADAVTDLVTAFHTVNDCGPMSVQVVLFSATSDLRSAKPAAAARAAGWASAQFLCLAEMPTDDEFPRCIRALLFVDRGVGADALKPVYLNGTHTLRPDLHAHARS